MKRFDRIVACTSELMNPRAIPVTQGQLTVSGLNSMLVVVIDGVTD